MYKRLQESITQFDYIAIRETNNKPGVLVQTQTLGIEFKPSYESVVTNCPKCGASNTAIYFPKLMIQRGIRGASCVCKECGIPYPIHLPEMK